MEIVKKIISLEPLRSRQFGLIPYYGMKTVDDKYVLSENGNWGNYPFDIDITKCKGYESLQECFGETNVVSFSQILRIVYYQYKNNASPLTEYQWACFILMQLGLLEIFNHLLKNSCLRAAALD